MPPSADVIPHPSVPDWRARERGRFESGEYRPVPWAGEPWADRHPDHFAHVSTEDPSQVAYVQSERHGVADRQTRTRPGRYLRKYYGDVLDDKEIQRWAGAFAGANESHEFKLARAPDEIEAAYENGPNSCMGGGRFAGRHPAHVYGAGDLAVAYLGDLEDRVTARCVVWPARCVRSTIYGDADRLRPALDAAGYERIEGGFQGARLLARRPDNGCGDWAAPYVDGDYSADYVDGYLVLQFETSGEYTLHSTDGSTEGYYVCQLCDCSFSEEPNNVEGQTWCDGCYRENAFHCDGCHETRDVNDGDNVYRMPDGDAWCGGCFESKGATCEKCGEDFPAEDAREVSGKSTTETWCHDCASEHATDCDACDCAYATEYVYRVVTGAHESETWCEDCVSDGADAACDACGDCMDEDGGRAPTVLHPGEDVCASCAVGASTHRYLPERAGVSPAYVRGFREDWRPWVTVVHVERRKHCRSGWTYENGWDFLIRHPLRRAQGFSGDRMVADWQPFNCLGRHVRPSRVTLRPGGDVAPDRVITVDPEGNADAGMTDAAIDYVRGRAAGRPFRGAA